MKNDFSTGSLSRWIFAQSFPLMIAQLVHLLYNVVDRIYIGHMEGIGTMALTGIGLVFPLTTIVAAFTNMFGMGGVPLFSIARGEKDEKKAETILSQVASYLIISSIILLVFCYLYRKPILYLFGASDESYFYANEYLQIYLLGTTFAMFSTGLNGFINAQGYPRMGMMTIVIGAILNLILDPIFIFVCHMGVRGAALATVISQIVSAIWVFQFIQSKTSNYHIRKEQMIPDMKHLKDISSLGFANFIFQATNCLVQVLCNVTLRTFGGDVYVGVMTVLNSVREILQLPCSSFSSGAQPIISYNFGARKYQRVKKTIVYLSWLCGIYLMFAWALVQWKPEWMISIFTNDTELLDAGVSAIRIYFFGFVFMTFQQAGQNSFTAMKCSKRAVFFSLLRKVIIVAPLTVILPRCGFGVMGVWLAEPVSNVVGGLACYITMYFTVYRRLPKEDGEVAHI